MVRNLLFTSLTRRLRGVANKATTLYNGVKAFRFDAAKVKGVVFAPTIPKPNPFIGTVSSSKLDILRRFYHKLRVKRQEILQLLAQRARVIAQTISIRLAKTTKRVWIGVSASLWLCMQWIQHTFFNRPTRYVINQICPTVCGYVQMVWRILVRFWNYIKPNYFRRGTWKSRLKNLGSWVFKKFNKYYVIIGDFLLVGILIF